MKKILIIEDDPGIQSQLKWSFSKEYEVLQASDRLEALKIFKKYMPQVVTLDLGLPPDEMSAEEGLSCLNEIMTRSPETKVIVVTGNSDRENALKAVQMGAYDYFLKPIDMQELEVIIKRAVHLSDIESENRKLHNLLERENSSFGMIGESPYMRNVFNMIRKVANTDATILITGESGTGKELVTRAIHGRSTRSKGPFIPINCGAIPENLLESELFGHEKGAFTGAYAQQKGKFEFADGGTLLLDEIGEMPTRLQAKLLRFLQEKKIQRVGGRSDIELDCRIIAATNIDLNQAISDATFRKDLFFRISVITIHIPPLRERGDDIRLLADTFLERYNVMFRKKIKGFSLAAMDAIVNHSWPGNVRELENRLQKAVITTEKNLIEPHNLELGEGKAVEPHAKQSPDGFEGMSLRDARKKLEINLIKHCLQRHGGNIKRASEELGVSRPTLYDLLQKYKLSLRDKSG